MENSDKEMIILSNPEIENRMAEVWKRLQYHAVGSDAVDKFLAAIEDSKSVIEKHNREVVTIDSLSALEQTFAKGKLTGDEFKALPLIEIAKQAKHQKPFWANDWRRKK